MSPTGATPSNRWKCPDCGSDAVQISLPTWYTETKDGTLLFVETDLEADIQWWWCPDCSEQGFGNPDEAQ